jgi:hypothetical protein
MMLGSCYGFWHPAPPMRILNAMRASSLSGVLMFFSSFSYFGAEIKLGSIHTFQAQEVHSTETISDNDYSAVGPHSARGHVRINGQGKDLFSLF